MDAHHIKIVDSDAVPGDDGLGQGYCDYLDVDCGGNPQIAEPETWDREVPEATCGFASDRRCSSTDDENLEDAFGWAASLRGGFGQEAMMGSLLGAAEEGPCERDRPRWRHDLDDQGSYGTRSWHLGRRAVPALGITRPSERTKRAQIPQYS